MCPSNLGVAHPYPDPELLYSYRQAALWTLADFRIACRAVRRDSQRAPYIVSRVNEWQLGPGAPDNHFFDCLVGLSSNVLYFTSAAGPEWGSATVTGSWSAMEELPSPSENTLCPGADRDGLLMLGGVGALIRRQRKWN